MDLNPQGAGEAVKKRKKEAQVMELACKNGEHINIRTI